MYAPSVFAAIEMILLSFINILHLTITFILRKTGHLNVIYLRIFCHDLFDLFDFFNPQVDLARILPYFSYIEH